MKQLKDSRGFSLVEVMIGSLMLGGIGVGIVAITKQQANQNIKAKIESDIAQFKAEVMGILSNPAHCNANLAGTTPGTDVIITNLYMCDIIAGSQDCLSAGRVMKYTAFSGTSPIPWPNPPAAGQISERVKIIEIKRTITDINVSPTQRSLSTATFAIKFASRPLNGPINIETMSFSAAVVENDSNVIVGCPRSWNTTNVYDAP